jgi:diguanylate cyclase (GGDEF)-like protein
VHKGRETGQRCILAVDDDRILLAKLQQLLAQSGHRVIAAPSAEAALALLHELAILPDIVLIDVSLPGMSGFELAQRLQQQGAGLPFLFLSADPDPTLARRAAACGALGYLVKPVDLRHVLPAVEAALLRAVELRQQYRIRADLQAALASGQRMRELMQERLRRLLAEHACEVARLERQLARAEAHMRESRARAQALSRLVNEDALTGLPNRNWLREALPLAMERAHAGGRMLALIYLDLDGFKAVNDRHGHAAGDELLQAAALRMRAVLKPGDQIVRLGGDEFVALIERIESDTDASHVAMRLGEALRNPFELAHGRTMIGMSAGIALYPRDATDGNALLNAADMAMYAAKSAGKGRYRFHRAYAENRRASCDSNA